MFKFSGHSDLELSAIAFGTYQIPAGEATYKAVSEALDCGYTSVDTARFYNNEEDVGRAVKNFGERIQITTKVWNNNLNKLEIIDMGKGSRDKLQVSAIDLYLMHWPSTSEKNLLETWEALETLKDDGVVKHIGVSNFNQRHFEILNGEGFSRPESNQVEVNPLFTQEKLRVYCQNLGIIVEAWRPLLHNNLDMLKGSELGIETIARKYRKTLAQVCLRWGISNGMRVLAKSVDKKRMKENIDIFDFDLTSEEIDRIDAMNRDFRQGPDPEVFDFIVEKNR